MKRNIVLGCIGVLAASSITITSNAADLSTSFAVVEPYFDATFYAEEYPDVVAAVGTDEAALFNHYVTSGYAEDRCLNAGLDLKEYEENNTDLQVVFGDNALAYVQHYVTSGVYEGRNGYGVFDAAENPDAIAIVGSDTEALLQHYVKNSEYAIAETTTTVTTTASASTSTTIRIIIKNRSYIFAKASGCRRQSVLKVKPENFGWKNGIPIKVDLK